MYLCPCYNRRLRYGFTSFASIPRADRHPQMARRVGVGRGVGAGIPSGAGSDNGDGLGDCQVLGLHRLNEPGRATTHSCTPLRGKMGHNLTDQTAIITGAGSGLGTAIARALASEGARCALAGRRPEPLEHVRLEIGDLARAIPCDMRDEAQIENLVAQTVAEFGGVDILVNNAGVFQEVPLTDTTTL